MVTQKMLNSRKLVPVIFAIVLELWAVDKSDALSQSLPSLFVRGSHYDVGYTVGRTFCEKIQAYYSEHPSLRPVWLPWSHTPEGRTVVQDFLTVERAHFPQYVRELEGMAMGANVTFLEMFLANHYVELSALLANHTKEQKNHVDSCSDLLVNRPNQNCVMLAHNEDNTPLIQNKAYILTATITDTAGGGGILENFTAYCYPGQLPGNAFGFNHHGLVVTVNGLYPQLVEPSRVGRSFINRAMLVARDITSAVDAALKSSAYGLSANIGVLPRAGVPPRLYNVEVAPNARGSQSRVSVLEVTATAADTPQQTARNYFHVNMYRRISLPEISSHIQSSIHRTKRIEQFSPPSSFKDVASILGDTKDADFPIYRHPQKTDNETTLATAVYDLIGCTLSVYQDNPKTSRGPLTVLPLPCS